MVMSRNATAHFAQVPRADIQRSRWKTNKRVLTTMNAGELVPIYNTEILPGDTLSIDTSSLIRMSTPIFPVMDNCYMDVYFFFVPNRIIWDHWRELNGENRSTYWTQPTEYRVPTVSSPVGGFNKGSLADHMEWPTDVGGYVGSALYFRAYVAIWNEFFRDQNYMPPAYLNTGDVPTLGYTASGNIWDSITDAIHGGQMLPVSKFHDYFTSVLPAPQKGNAVDIPYFSDSMIPVGAFEDIHGLSTVSLHNQEFAGEGNRALFESVDGYLSVSDQTVGYSSGYGFYPGNLWADLTEVTIGTINELRQAFQIQRLLERDARSGTRYTEILNAHFGVTSPDARLQRPEYLGGKRIPINIDQVLQTSATSDVSPQGNTAAFSLTSDLSSSFTKSFTEHGILLGLACIRTDHTYQQGLHKRFQRRDRFDYYWPALAHISEQPVLRSEILMSTVAEENEQVFGYQEAWADYRYEPSVVTGAFRSNYQGTLDAWHYADSFDDRAEIFIADKEFLAETKNNIDRTLAVPSEMEDQFLCNFEFRNTWVRPMPLFSVPGLIDHF